MTETDRERPTHTQTERQTETERQTKRDRMNDGENELRSAFGGAV